MLLAADPDIAMRLTQAKATAEADDLRNQIRELTAQLDKTRRKLKAEKGFSKRLRRKLDALNNQTKEDTMTDQTTTETPEPTAGGTTERAEERTAAGLAEHSRHLTELLDAATKECRLLRRYTAAAAATLAMKEDDDSE
ncbi:hypothetical protein, partial [Bifidobacterium saguinibicoloris]|uniref:hypothetical protein n=1 Tax=Bifidobacterium saguinibicoloris TaxID=2834433 RepID=UPI001C5A4F87